MELKSPAIRTLAVSSLLIPLAGSLALRPWIMDGEDDSPSWSLPHLLSLHPGLSADSWKSTSSASELDLYRGSSK